jgi:hypothetical protein
MFAYRTGPLSISFSRHVRRLAIGSAVAAAAALGAMPVSAQFEKTLSTTYDGWRELPDGSYDLVFGYMNRNTGEVEVPLGPNNQIEPAPADHGQPTNFLPGRQRDAFRIHVPKEFKGKFVWTVTYAGTTQTATGSLDQNYSLDVGDPDPPMLKAGPDRTVRLAEAAELTATVTPPKAEAPADPGNGAVVARRARNERISVWWSKFRGPGTVTFGGETAQAAANSRPSGREFALGTFQVQCAVPVPAGCGNVTARFSAPGTYWLRVVAAERSATNAIVKVVVNP